MKIILNLINPFLNYTYIMFIFIIDFTVVNQYVFITLLRNCMYNIRDLPHRNDYIRLLSISFTIRH